MEFIKKYGFWAFIFLFVYGIFILGSISGGIRVTGNAIDFLAENTDLFIYVGISIAGLILVGGLVWFLMRFFKERNLKKRELQELNSQNKKIGLYEDKKQKERRLKPKKILNVKLNNNQKINELLLQGGRALMNKDISGAEKIYLQIKELYNFKEDKDKKLYERIVNYYNNLINEK